MVLGTCTCRALNTHDQICILKICLEAVRGTEQSGRETGNNIAVITLPRTEQGRGSEGSLLGMSLFIFFTCILSAQLHL